MAIDNPNVQNSIANVNIDGGSSTLIHTTTATTTTTTTTAILGQLKKLLVIFLGHFQQNFVHFGHFWTFFIFLDIF